MKLDNKSMTQSDRCELFGALIDVVEDWLEEKGITTEDIPNPDREDEDSAIIYGEDYDYLANRFSTILEIDRDIDDRSLEEPSSIQKITDKLTSFTDIDADFADNFGGIVCDAVMEMDNYPSDISRDIIRTFSQCKTKEEVDIANNMLIAITGWSLDSLLSTYEKEHSVEDLEKE